MVIRSCGEVVERATIRNNWLESYVRKGWSMERILPPNCTCKDCNRRKRKAEQAAKEDAHSRRLINPVSASWLA